MTFSDFVKEHGITICNPDLTDKSWTGKHYHVTLTMGDRHLRTYFSMGSAYTEPPTAADVLECLAADTTYADQSFEEWAAEYGYDEDSRNAERIYNTVVRQTKELKAWAGDLYDELLSLEG